MANKPTEIHPAALSELKSALSWYMERNESAAFKFSAEIDRAIKLVTESSKRWPAGEHGSRRFVLRRFPYALVYREANDSIQVLAIQHGHRRPGYWKDRL